MFSYFFWFWTIKIHRVYKLYLFLLSFLRILFAIEIYLYFLQVFCFLMNESINAIRVVFCKTLLNICKLPKFPITGDYLKEHGYQTGETLGKKLKSLEEKWIENNFVIKDNLIEKSLRKENKN